MAKIRPKQSIYLPKCTGISKKDEYQILVRGDFFLSLNSLLSYICMERKYIVTVVPQGWNWEESYFRYTLPKFNELINSMYDNQDDALEAIIKFITLWTKDTTLKNRYFKSKFELLVDHFIVSEAPEYRVSGFDSKEDMLDYNAYTG